MNMGEIQIIFNGRKETVPENTTIADLIVKTKEKDGGLIVEHNNKFIFQRQYEMTVLTDGDKVEFINPEFGG
ncbi:sulfur carrier protein ThiS [bacterium]|nr:MAG: sulfur carrier protein ThiS [bacterium]